MTLATQIFLILTTLLGISCFMYRVSVTRQDFSVAEIVPLSTALFFGVTPFIWLLLRDSDAHQYLALSTSDGLETAAFSFLLYMIGTIICLFWVRSLPVSSGATRVISQLHIIPLSAVLAVFAALWSLRLLLASVYGVYSVDSGTVQTAEGIPYGLVVVLSLARFFEPLLAAWGLSQLLHGGRYGAFLPWLLITSETLYAFSQGRRAMLFLMLALIIVYLIYRRRASLKFLVLLCLGAVLLATTAFPVFIGAREFTSRYTGADRIPVLAYYQAAAGSILMPDLMDLYRRNVAHRSAVYLGWSAEIARAQEAHDQLAGRALEADFIASVPRLLLDDKPSRAWAETLINSHYGLPQRDSPSSLAALGLADFGVVGSLVYGFLFVLSLLIWEMVAVRAWFAAPMICSAAIFQLLGLAFHVELSLNTVVVVWRNFVLLIVLIWLIRTFFFGRRSKPLHQPLLIRN